VATVLDQTFNTVELVGKPLSIGHFVNTNSISAVFTSTTHTYSPYVRINREDANIGDDLVFHGADYQEVLTNFPFGSQILTGLFLETILAFPGGKTETIEKTLFDRIGFAVRQNNGSSAVSISADAQPTLSTLDIVTLAIAPSGQDRSSFDTETQALESLASELNTVLPSLHQSDPVQQTQALQKANFLSKGLVSRLASFIGQAFLISSEDIAAFLQTSFLAKSYFDSPRIVAISNKFSDSRASGRAWRAVHRASRGGRWTTRQYRPGCPAQRPEPRAHQPGARSDERRV
jgi:hypothetical protein